jgi:hypothetical protein
LRSELEDGWGHDRIRRDHAAVLRSRIPVPPFVQANLLLPFNLFNLFSVKHSDIDG